jgi:UDP-N-acetylglucosamine:LPS N-acetylglucosamine transferase
MDKKAKICFAASSGGHLEQILMLTPLSEKYDGFLMTEKTEYALTLPFEKTYLIPQINRKELMFFPKFIKLFFLSWQIIKKEAPDIIISTGALSTFPVCLISKIAGKKIIFIESFAKTSSKTLTGKLVYKFADLFIVQWEEMKALYPRAVYGGSIY